MTHRVDAVMDAMQPPDPNPIVDRVRAEADTEQLPVGDDAVLRRRKSRDRPLEKFWDL